jgi:CMP/dCMP kinase
VIHRQRHELQIAIDGPAGAGKSTVAKLVAKRLGLFYVDTGAMYRAIAFKALTNGIPIEFEEKVSETATKTQVVLDHSGERLVWCDGQNVTQEIRSPEISRAVSTVASYKKVRERLVELQRMEAARGGVVMDGRDIGTYVLPEADLKIFLTATAQERARRRWIELQNAGKNVSLEEVARDMERRDRQDMEREISPLEPASDAIILDTTGLEVEDIVAKILRLAKEG